MAALTLETVELSPQVWCIRIGGELDSSNLGRLKEAFEQIFSRKIYKVVVNLEKARYVASSGIGCLIGGYTTAIKNGGRLVLSGVPLQVKEVLNLIGLTGVLRFADNEAGALRQF